MPESGAMTQAENTPMVLGVIVGNRGFFPDHLARSGRRDMISALTARGIKPIVLDESESKFGAVETRQEAARCAELFKKHREQIGAARGFLAGFHRAELGFAFVQDDRLYPPRRECRDHVSTAGTREMVWEESAVSHNDAEHHRCVLSLRHSSTFGHFLQTLACSTLLLPSHLCQASSVRLLLPFSLRYVALRGSLSQKTPRSLTGMPLRESLLSARSGKGHDVPSAQNWVEWSR